MQWSRTFLCLWLTLSLVAVPALCRGGVWRHACAAHDDASIADAHIANGCGDHHAAHDATVSTSPQHASNSKEDCRHEDDCSDDPCNQVMARPEQNARNADDASMFAPDFDHAILDGVVIDAISLESPDDSPHAYHSSSDPPSRGLPFAASDVPLRV